MGSSLVTHYETVEKSSGMRLCSKYTLKPVGLHQICVYMAAIKHPAGGPALRLRPRACEGIGFEAMAGNAGELPTHPGSGEWVTFHADLPADLQNALDVVSK